MQAHLIFFVQDQAASGAFYAQVLGRAPRLDVPGMTEFQLGEGAVLGLMPERSIARLLGPPIEPAQVRGPGRAELYLLVDAPGSYHARALACGARELSPLSLRSWGHEVAYSLDVDGHVLAFARAAEGGEPA
ncbi:VOC family protein [Chondromyces crocatus]|uniref:Lactoylglutathione lyase n=1 Tax=Chondromyces crocatus TaxID=52 RepID=A0A0K1ECV4_CHOCO|nr:VOC family protein [Chondromyces crocatus]AKT38527.1 lactoylglutathione lyase [Chondromyces crocatus]